MTIYECLGMGNKLLNFNISKNDILANIPILKNEIDITRSLSFVDAISLKLSINRAKHYLQVIEVKLNHPVCIDEISYIIQKAIRYRVLFIFTYEERYIILWRNFQLTNSTDHVYSEHICYCTDWIYGECLNSSVLLEHNITEILDYDDEDMVLDKNAQYSYPIKELSVSADNGDTIYFKDIFACIDSLNRSIIDCSYICYRAYSDWFSAHTIGTVKDSMSTFMEIMMNESFTFIGDHLFLEKSRTRNIVYDKGYWVPNIDRTGRHSSIYFEGVKLFSSFQDEADAYRAYQIGKTNGFEFINRKIFKQSWNTRSSFEQSELDNFLSNRYDDYLPGKTLGNIKLISATRNKDLVHCDFEVNVQKWFFTHTDISLSLYSIKNNNDKCFFTFNIANNTKKDTRMEFNISAQNKVHRSSVKVERGNNIWHIVSIPFDEKTKEVFLSINNAGTICPEITIVFDNDSIMNSKAVNCTILSDTKILIEGNNIPFDYDGPLDESEYEASTDLYGLSNDFFAPSKEYDEESGKDGTAIYDNDDVYVEFCFIQREGDECYLCFWSRNSTNNPIHIWAQDLYVDGKLHSNYVRICELQPFESKHTRIKLNGISIESFEHIESYVEIDDIQDLYIDEGNIFTVDFDFEEFTHSTRVIRFQD